MFVTFEGPEGSGKSTALQFVAEELVRLGHKVCATREPGGGPLGDTIRKLLLESGELSAETELFLFLADRSQHVQHVIKPAMDRGEVVLCDRFADSTLVYQGYARGLSLELLRELNSLATDGLAPDLTLLFDLDSHVGLERLKSRDRLDREPLEFHEKVRQGFLSEARREPKRWRIIDASLSEEQVARAALDAVRGVLPEIAGRVTPQARKSSF